MQRARQLNCCTGLVVPSYVCLLVGGSMSFEMLAACMSYYVVNMVVIPFQSCR